MGDYRIEGGGGKSEVKQIRRFGRDLHLSVCFSEDPLEIKQLHPYSRRTFGVKAVKSWWVVNRLASWRRLSAKTEGAVMMHRKTKERGVYLLEVGASIVGVALFLMAVNDGTRLYQARSAVRAAVHEGLRCLYPTDAGCNSSTNGFTSSSSERMYNVFVSSPVIGYSVAQETLHLRSSWTTAPVFEVPLTKTSVTSVTIQSERDRFVQQEVLFPVNAGLPYVVQKRPLPKIGGADPLRPSFYHPTTGRSLSPNNTFSLASIRGVTKSRPASKDDEYNSRFKIGERTFSLSDAWSSYESDVATIRNLEKQHKISVQCYQGPLTSQGKIDWESSSAPRVCSYRSASNRLYKNGELHVPLMFHISGRISSADPGAEGKVLISMSWNGKTRRLGGRLLSPGGSGSFVVRGASWSDIRDDAEGPYRIGGRYEQEIDLHGALETIPLDTRVKLTFTLVSLNGKEIAWTGGEMSLFYPTFDLVDQRYTCAHSSDPKRCVNPPRRVPILFSEVDKKRELSLRDVDGGECSETAPAALEVNPQARLSELKARVQRALPVTPVTMLVRAAQGAPACTPLRRTVGCDAPLGPEVPQGCEVTPELSRIPALCGIALQSGRESVVGVGTGARISDSKARYPACSTDGLPECARPHAREVERVFLPYSEEARSCRDASISNAPGITIGPIDVNTCGDNSANNVAQYRQNNIIPSLAPVVVERRAAPSRSTAEQVSAACVQSETTILGTKESEWGRNVPWAEFERCRSENGGACREELVVGDREGHGTMGNNSTLVNAAEQRTVDTVRAAYPAAQRKGECQKETPDCLEVDGQVIDDTKVTLSARMSVPLTLLKPFRSTGVVVEHSAQRASEHALIWR